MFLSKRMIACGERIPRGYRVAYWDYPRAGVVVYPFGVHYLVMLCHRVWQCSYWYRPSWVEKLQDDLRVARDDVERFKILWQSAECEADRLRCKAALEIDRDTSLERVHLHTDEIAVDD
ncbi:MAG: hypothetical protein WCY34_02840 [Candidatus Omnitrophota bacterium]